MQWLFNPVVELLLIFLAIVIFVKFAGWASTKTVSAGFKKAVYWLTGLGLIVCNVLFALTGGPEAFEVGKMVEGHLVQGNSGMIVALLVSLILVFLFTFALMAEGPKSEA